MAQPLTQMFDAGSFDMIYVDYDEMFYIVDEKRPGKWFLRNYDKKTNKCIWTTSIKHALDFDTEAQAIEYATATGRNYSIETHDSWFC